MVVYIRTTYSDAPPTVTLVMAKTKVAPLKRLTIPHLELCGAPLLAKLLTHVRLSLKCFTLRHVLLVQLMSILHWLDRSPCWYHTFVRNRISTILSNLFPTSWHYVPTQDNPADCASQGLLPQALLDHHLWWRDPDWLQIDPISWHPQPFSSPIGTPELSEAVCNLILPSTAAIPIHILVFL